MLITSRGTGRWVIPKGWPMVGVSGAESAAQEALEEAGVVGETAAAIGSYPYDKLLKTGEFRAVEVEVYPLAVHQEYADWKEVGERTREWFSREEAASKVAEPELADLIAGFNP
jgi:8-oxo-dGTP pyrophosphatase MutT (NUDIX family)